MKNSTKFKAGMLLMSLGMAAGATAALVLLQKKREEEVYHEAELKAMDELEQMMREPDCDSCSCAAECPSTEATFQQQTEDSQAAEQTEQTETPEAEDETAEDDE